MENKNLIAVFLSDGLILDYEETAIMNYYQNDFLLNESKTDLYTAIYNFGFEEFNSNFSPSLSYIHSISNNFIHSLTKDPGIEFTRIPNEITKEEIELILRKLPFALGAENITEEWIKNIHANLIKVFQKDTIGFKGTISEYLTSKNPKLQISGRIFFHLVESNNENFPFAFLATYSTKKPENKSPSHIPLKNALLEYKGRNDLLLKLLSTVNKASTRSKLISDMVTKGEIFSPLKFTAEEAYAFLREVPLYEECGIICRIPHWWKKTSSISMTIQIGNKPPSEVGMSALLEFEPKLIFGEEEMTREEIESLMISSSGLRLIKGKWVEADLEKLGLALDAFDRANALAKDGSFTLAQAMRLQLDSSSLPKFKEDGLELTVTRGQWLNTVSNNLLNPSRLKQVSPGKGFKGILRPYQQTGLDWLTTMHGLGFGALLADDMGLGKTIQILALLELLTKKNNMLKFLLVIPASLFGNWEKEILRFTPKLKYSILHGKEKEESKENISLYITSYGMVSRISWLKDKKWDVLIIDEAQAIKNPGTVQSKAVRKLFSKFKIAMTGTPIENTLSELWSIFDYLNKGMLGTAKEFDNFVKESQENNNYSEIRESVSPFILRRLKTDKNIISDLPEKIELKEYTALSQKQSMLYIQVVNEIKDTLENAQGISRKGLILGAITKFKQICNHPDQFLGLADFNPENSGKFIRLKEICETIRDKRERVLIFTQFRQMTKPLSEYLEDVFGRKGIILHGGTPVKKRAELVEMLNGKEYIPFMILSLKAGGVGLNLTGASHVIHFDRWWNPAVENQATDRAFRIGQTKNVMVHKFITSGTIEEKIDKMIERKEKLAADIIQSSGDKWITEMSNDELLDLFSISK